MMFQVLILILLNVDILLFCDLENVIMKNIKLNNKGFILIELMIVVVIIGILVVVVLFVYQIYINKVKFLEVVGVI